MTALVDGLAVGRRRPAPAEPLHLVAEFDDDADAAHALAASVRAAAHRWGVCWFEERAARLAREQAMWLLANEHPAGTHLCVHVEYVAARRVMTIVVGDPGGLLPALADGEEWWLSADAFHHSGRNRRLRRVLSVRAPWRLRITWDTSQLEGRHPEQSFEDCNSKDDMHTCVAIALRLDAVRAVHWQSPCDQDEDWHELGDAPGICEGPVA